LDKYEYDLRMTDLKRESRRILVAIAAVAAVLLLMWVLG
jgi:hypothetical protein